MLKSRPHTYRFADDETGLIEQLVAGDEAAYEFFVRTHSSRMIKVALRFVRSEDEARDCVQEAFIQAFRNIDRFAGNAKLATWLHRIVVNAALMRLRKQKRRAEQAIDELLPDLESMKCRVEPSWDFSEPLEDMVDRREVQMLVRQSIDRLPESYRTVLLLRDIEGFDTDETATLLSMNSGTVKIRLHRARAALKKLLEPIFRETDTDNQ